MYRELQNFLLVYTKVWPKNRYRLYVYNVLDYYSIIIKYIILLYFNVSYAHTTTQKFDPDFIQEGL